MDAILPLCCFPSTQWLKIACGGAFIDIHENYIKQTYRNRFDLLGVNGIQTLTIPVVGQKGEKVKMRDIQIEDGTWRKQHLRSIRAAYGRAPYFEHYFDDLEKIFLERKNYLTDFNGDVINWMKRCGLSFSFVLSDSYIEKSDLNDYREKFEPSFRWPTMKPYPQVFSDRHSFQSGLSVIDLLMNVGPKSKDFLIDL